MDSLLKRPFRAKSPQKTVLLNILKLTDSREAFSRTAVSRHTRARHTQKAKTQQHRAEGLNLKTACGYSAGQNVLLEIEEVQKGVEQLVQNPRCKSDAEFRRLMGAVLAHLPTSAFMFRLMKDPEHDSAVQRMEQAEERLMELVRQAQPIQLNYCDIEGHKKDRIYAFDPFFLEKQYILEQIKGKFVRFEESFRVEGKSLFSNRELCLFEKVKNFTLHLIEFDKGSYKGCEHELLEEFKRLVGRVARRPEEPHFTQPTSKASVTDLDKDESSPVRK